MNTSIDADKLNTLIEINTLINSNYSDINALLVRILESAMRLVTCESSSLLLVNKDDDSLRFELALGPKGSEAKSIPVSKSSIAGWVNEHCESVVINDVAHDPRFFSSVQEKTGYLSKNMIAVPMRVKNSSIGVIELLNKANGQDFTKEDLDIIEQLSTFAVIAYQNAVTFRQAQDEISVLQNAIASGPDYHTFVAKSPAVLDLLKVVEQLSSTNSSVLILGESGVGKELFAEQIHLRSERAKKPFVRVNCAALSPLLLESELFGHVKGSFTDAVSNRKGRFEIADGGTIFLDEIGELPLDLQVKLLRVIQTKSFEKVGSSETQTVDVRIVAATNRDIEEMVRQGQFRSDLYYRLNVLPIYVPPLRERKLDIEPLALNFLRKFSGATKKAFSGFSEEAMALLNQYSWPGNVRELENTVERACVLGVPPLIKSSDLRLNVKPAGEGQDVAEALCSEDRTLKTALNNFKKAYITKILDETSWNQTKTGEILGIQRTYVSRLMNELGIRS